MKSKKGPWTKNNKSFESYTVNPNKIINLDSPEASYALGLLWADGTIQHNNEIRLETVSEDADHYFKILLKLGQWNRSFRKRPNRQAQSTIYISNKPIVRFLRSLGFISRREVNMDLVLKHIPLELHRYFFIGLIDGDGCYYFSPDRRCCQFSISARKNQDWSTLEHLFKTLDIYFGVGRSKINSKSQYSYIRTTGIPNISKLCNYLYQKQEDTLFTLPRKLKKIHDMGVILNF